MARKTKKKDDNTLPLPIEEKGGRAKSKKGKPDAGGGKRAGKKTLVEIPDLNFEDGLPFSANARAVLERRYLRKDDQGNSVEHPGDLLARVAKAIASVETKHDKKADVEALARKFQEMMQRLEFLPNSPTLMNAGRKLGQLSACFVLPVEDSMEAIFEAVKHTALIHKSGGGTGFSFSRLRPKHDRVLSTKGVASGPISFMNVFDLATETVKQGGTRRGANMAILRVDHPDILDFITAKADLDWLTNFNISVGATEAFMKAVEKGSRYDLVNPRTGEVTESLSARKVFDLIVEMAWRNGEPGVVFLDRLNEANPTPEVGEIEATNPCGEQPLLPYESCNLGSINLSVMEKDGKVDYQRLGAAVKSAVHFLDNVVDANRYPLTKISKQTLGNRKIGLGVMGFADLLLKLAIPYDSEDALKTGEAIMSFIQKEGRKASEALAKQRGVFPNFDKSVYCEKGPRLRNATVTTIAPTGTLSILAGASSGVEPVFALGFERHVMDDDRLVELNPVFVEIAKREGFYSEKLLAHVAETGSVAGRKDVPAKWRKVLVTALEIEPSWHIRMQAAFQKYTDNAVSKTVNFPEDAEKSDVEEAFMLAYHSGCKGVTVYRYGSRKPVLNIGSDAAETGEDGDILYDVLQPRPRRSKLQGSTEMMKVGCGKLYVTVNRDELGICEVFTTTGRSGGCPSQSEAVSRLVSLALRCGISVDTIIRQLRDIRCHSALRRNNFKNGPDKTLPCPTAIALALGQMHDPDSTNKRKDRSDKPITPRGTKLAGSGRKRKTSQEIPQEPPMDVATERALVDKGICPDCGETLALDGGCVVCRSCGFSRCG